MVAGGGFYALVFVKREGVRNHRVMYYWPLVLHEFVQAIPHPLL